MLCELWIDAFMPSRWVTIDCRVIKGPMSTFCDRRSSDKVHTHNNTFSERMNTHYTQTYIFIYNGSVTRPSVRPPCSCAAIDEREYPNKCPGDSEVMIAVEIHHHVLYGIIRMSCGIHRIC